MPSACSQGQGAWRALGVRLRVGVLRVTGYPSRDFARAASGGRQTSDSLLPVFSVDVGALCICHGPVTVVQLITIVISEYRIPYPAAMKSLKNSFSWVNLNVFELFQTGCKVRGRTTCTMQSLFLQLFGVCHCPSQSDPTLVTCARLIVLRL